MLFLVIVAAVFVIAHLSKKNKLRIIKYAVLVIGGGVIAAAKCGVKAAKPFELPLKWLLHYVAGSGTKMIVPLKTVKAAKSAFMETIYRNDRWPVFGNKHCLYHSTLYEGKGFYGRPTLFYLVGGFTFVLHKDGRISGKDCYDWHANPDGNYFTSPLGTSKWAVFFMALLDLVFGNDWFVTGGFPSSEAGISNKLWDDLHIVGARPFMSYFGKYEVFTEDDILFLWLAETNETFREDSADGAVFRKVTGVTARTLCPTAGLNDCYLVEEYQEQEWLLCCGRWPLSWHNL